MSGKSPAPEAAAAAAPEVLDLNADVAVVDALEPASVGTTVEEEAKAASSEAVIEPSEDFRAPAEVGSDGPGRVPRQRQPGGTVAEAKVAAAAAHSAAERVPNRLEDSKGVANLVVDVVKGQNDGNRTAEAEVHVSTGTKITKKRSDVAVAYADDTEEDRSRSVRTDPTEEKILRRDVVAPDLNAAVESENTYPQPAGEKASDQADLFSRDGSPVTDVTIAEILPENTARRTADRKDLVGTEASVPASGMDSLRSSQTTKDRSCRDPSQVEVPTVLLDVRGQKVEEHGDAGPINEKAAGLGDAEENDMDLVHKDLVSSDVVLNEGKPSKREDGGLNLPSEDVEGEVTGSDAGGDQNEREVLEEGDQPVLKSISPSSREDSKHVSYGIAYEDKSSFSVSDLVWGKVKSHPWWPGQIFDPLDASDMALKHQKKDHFLVAYFGDKTFAWCDETKLRPFQGCFSQLANQSTSDTFVTAVDNALAEASRRVELAMSCSCIPEKVSSNLKHHKIDNAGIREGSCLTVTDNTFLATTFQPDKFLDHLKGLAQYPGEETDGLELAVAKAQTITFNRLKDYTELFASVNHGGLSENDTVTSATRRKRPLNALDEQSVSASMDEEKVVADISAGKKKRKLQGVPEHGRKQKSLSELMEDKKHDDIENGDGTTVGMNVSEISLSPSSSEHENDDFAFGFPGKKIRELRDSDSAVGEPIENIKKKRGRKKKSATFDDPTYEIFGESSSKRGRKKKSESIDDSPDSNLGNSSSFMDEPDEKIKKKRGRKRKSDLKDDLKTDMSGASTPDYMTDSYWSDRLVCSTPEEKPSSGRQKRRGEQLMQCTTTKKTKLVQESLPLSKMMEVAHHLRINAVSPAKRDSAAEKQTTFFGDKRLEDSTPTALILSFNEPGALPSETNLIRIFSRYGPLKEAETEVLGVTKCAKVVFKRRADAEAAFSSAGRYRIFGPALISFRLKSPPSPLCTREANPNGRRDYEALNGLHLETPEEAKEPAQEEVQKLSQEDSKELVHQEGKESAQEEGGGSAEGETVELVLEPNEVAQGETMEIVQEQDMDNKENLYTVSANRYNLAAAPQAMSQTRMVKKGGHRNLRKSLAWNKAFFTDEGVLDPSELSILFGSATKSSASFLTDVNGDFSPLKSYDVSATVNSHAEVHLGSALSDEKPNDLLSTLDQPRCIDTSNEASFSVMKATIFVQVGAECQAQKFLIDYEERFQLLNYVC
ncbi:unnamed protein product [Spirodela intermedia]|uniref:PWWP domain-containing protein n=1 Tax=Spirodela intermedia TaxID=51605 RepID=A0A7I8IAT6_SPIIN|nr:unnamed protein product [Spirodela intermedia]CAA6654805.1 unnamed protein product [Spirodela intermedia]